MPIRKPVSENVDQRGDYRGKAGQTYPEDPLKKSWRMGKAGREGRREVDGRFRGQTHEQTNKRKRTSERKRERAFSIDHLVVDLPPPVAPGEPTALVNHNVPQILVLLSQGPPVRPPLYSSQKALEIYEVPKCREGGEEGYARASWWWEGTSTSRPWNYPIIQTFQPLSGTLIKPSEIIPTFSKLVAELVPKSLDPPAYRVAVGGVPEITKILEIKCTIFSVTIHLSALPFATAYHDNPVPWPSPFISHFPPPIILRRSIHLLFPPSLSSHALRQR
ncbi:hypothetical protein DFP72DRAFT_1108475 [Ephemerocybe angulata]|uniref:Uncharacterized protein n=1 Tax=Ephemerocybe angulata TaxID=980116 RepID=A0A8H6IJJ3_9AGAR|nr:hypothetical protein DFP72DRAFT_1108475 [Tulosesus angulatus]